MKSRFMWGVQVMNNKNPEIESVHDTKAEAYGAMESLSETEWTGRSGTVVRVLVFR